MGLPDGVVVGGGGGEGGQARKVKTKRILKTKYRAVTFSCLFLFFYFLTVIADCLK